MRTHTVSPFLLPVLLMTSACGGEAEVSVAFANTGPGGQALMSNVTPEEFGVKLVHISLSESTDEMGAPSGRSSFIYVNPVCDEPASCDSAAGDGVTNVVEDYFEFARATTEVNAALNAQRLAVEPRSYEWVRVEWCRDCGSVPTTRYRVDTWQAGDYVEYNKNQTVSEARLDPPLVIEDGDTVVVELSYDLTGLVVQEDSLDPCSVMGEPSCYSDGTQRFYIPGYIDFTPSARKE